MFSIGGATYTEGGFSEPDAINSASTIWQTFGPSNPEPWHRSFADAVINGFNFNSEFPATNMPAFGNRPRKLMNGQQDRAFSLTAAPPYSFPDNNVGNVLKNVQLDVIFVQFHNNPQYGLDAFTYGAPTGFKFDQWDQQAREESVSKNFKMMVDAPGSQDVAPSSGYVDAGQLGQIVEYSKRFSSMGGVMA